MDLRCADASARAGEPLAGTAAEARFWIAVQEQGPWAPKILDSPGLGALADVLRGWEGREGVRLQLIRRPAHRPVVRRRVYVADTLAGWVRELRLPCEAIAELELEALLSGEVGRPRSAPVYLVCTHGKRDDCCALRGLPVHRALTAAARSGDEVWQTSHLGGHRFAATLVTLPFGYVLGRVEPGEAAAIVAHEGLHDLARVRGRSALPRAAQVADVALREQLGGALPADAVRLQSLEKAPGGWIVRLDVGTLSGHTVFVRSEMMTSHQPKSCGAEPVAIERLLAGARS